MIHFFDLDGTITEPKEEITSLMKKALSKLENVVIVSGAVRKQIEKQICGLKCDILAQSGNHSSHWFNRLTEEEEIEISRHLQKIGAELNISVFSKQKYQNRGCQISFSFIGHDAPSNIKNGFDPERKYRKKILKQFPFKSKSLEVRIGGTTCLDYTRKDGTKGKNIKNYLDLKGIKKKDCIYYGDALFKGGNDESVVGIIKTVKIKNPCHLLDILSNKK